MEKFELRAGLPPLPDRMKGLAIESRGYPVPWFVQWIDGKPDFRIADYRKRNLAAKYRKCWICGGQLGKFLVFVIGPMCAVNRTTSEPACHHECALFAAKACPFMLHPAAQYRSANMPEGHKPPPGEGITGNPGVMCFWICGDFKIMRLGASPTDWLFKLNDPQRVEWYAEGKPANREQVMESLARRLPILHAAAEKDGPEAQLLLAEYERRAMKYLPATVPLGASA